MKQQTVVTWLINELIQNRLMALRYDKDNTFNEIVEQAKQMEEEQRRDAYDQGKADVIRVALESMDAKLSNSNE